MIPIRQKKSKRPSTFECTMKHVPTAASVTLYDNKLVGWIVVFSAYNMMCYGTIKYETNLMVRLFNDLPCLAAISCVPKYEPSL